MGRKRGKRNEPKKQSASSRTESGRSVASRSRWADGRTWLPLLVVLAGIIAYANSFSGQFVLDDATHILQNERIQSLDPLRLLRGRRPVVNLSLGINYALGKLDPWGYHAFNLGVHLLAGLALFGVVRRTLQLEKLRERYARAGPLIALAIAVLWVVHPLQTQSVTYVIQRGESLMGMFYLLTLYFVIRGAAAQRALPWYIAACVACGLGMGSKAVMITAPLMVLIYDAIFLSGSPAAAFRKRAGLYAGLAATFILPAAFGVVRGVMGTSHTGATVGFSVKEITPLQYLGTQPGVILQYLSLSVWPGALCLDYQWPVAQGIVAIFAPGLVVVALLALTVWTWRRSPAMAFLGIWFFLILAPTSSFIPIKDLLFEHRMYLSLAAVIALVVVGGDMLLRRFVRADGMRRNMAMVLVLATTGGFTWRTLERNRDYHSAIDMWTDVVHKRPSNGRAHCNLGIALADAGRLDEAIDHYHRAMKIESNDEPELAYNNLGTALEKKEQFVEAVAAYRKAVEIELGYSMAHSNMGNALMSLARIDEAIDAYETALSQQPRLAQTRYGLAVAFAAAGRWDEARQAYARAVKLAPALIDARVNYVGKMRRGGQASEEIVTELQRILEIDPKHPSAGYNLANALDRWGKPAEAINAYRAVLRHNPGHANAACMLGNVLSRQDRLDDAVEAYRQALAINPDHTKAHYNLAGVLLKLERFEAAAEASRQAVRTNPQLSAAHFRLGDALYRQGQVDKAIRAFQMTLQLQPNHAAARRALNIALQRSEAKNP